MSTSAPLTLTTAMSMLFVRILKDHTCAHVKAAIQETEKHVRVSQINIQLENCNKASTTREKVHIKTK